MDKYDVRIQGIQNRAKANQSSFESVGRIITDGAKLVDSIGSICGGNQSSDWMHKFNTNLTDAIASDRFNSKIDENGNMRMLTAEEIAQEYEAFMNEQLESAPKNPWAQGAIRKALDSSYDRNVLSIYQSSMEFFNGQKSKSFDSVESTESSAPIANAVQKNQETLSIYSMEYDDLTDYERGLFDSGSAVDSHLLVLSLNARRWGDKPEIARMYAEENRNTYAYIEASNMAQEAYRNDVINGGSTDAAFDRSLREAIAHATDFGFSNDLNESAQTELFNRIRADLDTMRTNAQNTNKDLIMERIIPVIAANREQGSNTQVSVVESMERQLGINTNMLPDEFRLLYRQTKERLSATERLQTAFSEADSIAASDMTDADKQKEYDRIGLGLSDNYELHSMFRAWHDSSPFLGHYSQYTSEELAQILLSDDSLLQGALPSVEPDTSKAGDIKTDRDVAGLISDEGFLTSTIYLALSTDKNVMASGAYPMDTIVDAFIDSMSPEQREAFSTEMKALEDASSGITRLDLSDEERKAMADIINSSVQIGNYSYPKSFNEQLTSWMEERQTRAVAFIDTYGDLKISGDTTLRQMYDDARKEAETYMADMNRGYHIIDTEDVVGEQARSNDVMSFFAKSFDMDEATREAEVNQIWSSMTKEEQSFYTNMYREGGYRSFLVDNGITWESMMDIPGIGNDNAFAKMAFTRAIFEHPDLVVNAMKNPSSTTLLSSAIHDYVETEANARILNRYGIKNKDKYVEITDWDGFQEAYDSADYRNPMNEPTDMVGDAVAMMINPNNNMDIRMAIANNFNVNMDGKAQGKTDESDIITEDDLLLYFASDLAGRHVTFTDIHDNRKQIQADTYSLLDSMDSYMQSYILEVASRSTDSIMLMREIGDLGINLSSASSDGYTYYVSDTSNGYPKVAMEVKATFGKNGKLDGLLYRSYGDSTDWSDCPDLYDSFIGRGLTQSAARLNEDLLEVTDWNQIWRDNPESTYENLVRNTLPQFFDSSEEWQKWADTYEIIYGYRPKPAFKTSVAPDRKIIFIES